MSKNIQSIGIIMDGNRRWARAHGRSVIEGHAAGYEALVAIAKELPRLKDTYGLEEVVLYTFSTENWNRSEEEVRALLALFERGMKELQQKLNTLDVKIRAVGDIERFPERLQNTLRSIEEATKNNTGGTVAFALSYGGRAEIVRAVNALVKEGGDVDEVRFAQKLWTTGMKDPDIIIRTSGEQRLSNFLPWQGVYAELFFTEVLWPDFTVEHLEAIFAEFKERERRHGK